MMSSPPHKLLRRVQIGRAVALVAVLSLVLPNSALAGFAANSNSQCHNYGSSSIKICLVVDYNLKNQDWPNAGGFYSVDTEQYHASVTRLDSTVRLTGLQMSGGVFGRGCNFSGTLQQTFNSAWVVPGNGTSYYYQSPWAGKYVTLADLNFQSAWVTIHWSRGTTNYSSVNRIDMPHDYAIEGNGPC